ncbi:hypothetical protein [Mesobacillus foraminis]|uniref:hypothetical protein n=1 Tax=Mesobacillus foraminis TaxID=279826 RepID=UPI0013CF3EE5|nr:hypothetical protein [Mesobacillus foraminis]
MEKLQPKQRQSQSNFLEKDKLLFSKEIEVMYDVKKSELDAFIEKELPPNN